MYRALASAILQSTNPKCILQRLLDKQLVERVSHALTIIRRLDPRVLEQVGRGRPLCRVDLQHLTEEVMEFRAPLRRILELWYDPGTDKKHRSKCGETVRRLGVGHLQHQNRQAPDVGRETMGFMTNHLGRNP